MSNFMHREIVSTYHWLKTYIPWHIERRRPVMTRLLRRGYREQMRKNRVWTALFNWLSGRNVDS